MASLRDKGRAERETGVGLCLLAGTAALFGVARHGAILCESVGLDSSDEGTAVSIASGVPGTADPISGTFQLYRIACPSATTCEAAGVNSSVSEGVLVVLCP